MNEKYGLGVLGWLLVATILVVVVVDDAYTWLQQGTVPGLEFFALGVAAVIVVALGVRSMQAHRPPPGQ
ncbi:hypothetical protein SAMN04487949_0403 [Halogranum gelatinilyticum]|uniref:Uncharacterized protein n=1 Tax=Halogranum gelatinilyticum TaxID=660521 RepID=A0A1G9PIK7_9EURY|nr:hypothetical protein [Halogranum gelatinilyticum]SDL98569.1 hypothetical protein SAMN04487949_0403 [Halogranum gelatinilyticum]